MYDVCVWGGCMLGCECGGGGLFLCPPQERVQRSVPQAVGDSSSVN